MSNLSAFMRPNVDQIANVKYGSKRWGRFHLQ